MDLVATTFARATQGADAEHESMLRQAQGAFEKYRQAECAAQGDTMRGGTNDADQAALCIIEKNHVRVAELRNDIGLAAH